MYLLIVKKQIILKEIAKKKLLTQNSKKITNAKFSSELPFLPKKTKKTKNLTNYQLLKELPFFLKKP